MSPAYASDFEVIRLNHDPIVTTIENADEKITKLERGQQTVIEIAAHNNMAASQHFVMVVEVRDGRGVTEYLAWQEGVAEPDSDFEIKFSWSPEQTCEFYEDCAKREIRSFAMSSLTEPRSVSSIATTGGITISGIST
ncbi:hypothetical protein [Candidatus Nitrososphaera evergladensis]|nr:hypothetical protein [Candidatus Nitrososphaera evergladensis]